MTMVDYAEPRVPDRLKRAVARAIMKRTVTIKRIKSIHALTKCSSPDPELVGKILVATNDLDKLWLQFEMDDAEVLDGLVQMDKLNEYDADLQAQIFDMVCSAKAASIRLRSPIKTVDHKPGKEPQSYRSTTKLPEISLPSFNGDFNYELTFRNRFSALVGRKIELSKIEQMYYTIECLQSPAAEAIRGIPRRLCYTCLSRDHWANMCQSKARCDTCFGKHHTLLHDYSRRQKVGTSISDGSISLCTQVICPELDNIVTVILGTALVQIRDRYGVWQTARALVDSASQISVITESCSQRLGFQPTNRTLVIRGLSGVPVLDIKGFVTCTINSRFANEPKLNTNAWVLPSITCSMPRVSLPNSVKEVFAKLALADPSFHVTSPVDLLLGADLFPVIMNGRKLVLNRNLPTAFNSIFGWIIIGPVFQSAVDWSVSLPVSLTASMEDLVEKFCHIEEPVAAPLPFTESDRCEEVLKDEHIQLNSDRLSMTLPICTAMSQMRRENSTRRFENLADYASRGVSPSELPALSLYWNGPSFLCNNPAIWAGIPPQILACDLRETRPVSLVFHTPDTAGYVSNHTSSSYDRLIRVIVWMYRFINGCRKSEARAYREVSQDNVGLATHRKLLDQCHQAFWRRLSPEYLTALQVRSKWTKTVPNIQINDMVVIIDNQLPPLMWRLGRVLDLLPGQDGVVRGVRVLTSQGQFTWPIKELVVLPIQ